MYRLPCDPYNNYNLALDLTYHRKICPKTSGDLCGKRPEGVLLCVVLPPGKTVGRRETVATE